MALVKRDWVNKGDLQRFVEDVVTFFVYHVAVDRLSTSNDLSKLILRKNIQGSYVEDVSGL